MLPNKFVIIWDGLPVGLDADSGGYPFKTTEIANMKFWNSKSEAEKYMSHWPDRVWFIREIQFRIVTSKG